MTDHPITPPPELLKRWEDDWFDEREHADVLLIQAFQAGADQELEACIGLLVQSEGNDAREFLRAARRPKPPSLKEQALEALERQCLRSISPLVSTSDLDTIRRALEALPDD
jgi:hypothetical protein